MSRLILILTTVLLILPTRAFAAYPEGEFGTYQYPESQEALPSELEPGKEFKGWPEWQRQIDWMAIPSWLASSWMSNDYRIVKRYDHQKDEIWTLSKGVLAPYKSQFGDLKDKQDKIWAANITPDVLNVGIDNKVDSENTVAIKPLEVQEEGVAMWQRLIHVVYDPQTRIIADSYWEERVTEYTPDGDWNLLARITNRFYDYGGSPTFTTNASRVMNKVKPFTPVYQRSGVDMALSLTEHLESIGQPGALDGEDAESETESEQPAMQQGTN